MVGINPGFDGLSIEPCLPDAWNDVSCSCVLRSCRVNIKIRRCRGNEIPDISFNGMAVESFPVPWSKFDRDGVNHLDIRI
jgi:cellobiose phosphorylase